MKKKYLTILRGALAILLASALLVGCAGKDKVSPEMMELQKQNQLTTMMVAQMEAMGKALAAQAEKDDCKAQVIAVPGKSIENMAGFTFACSNSGDKDKMVKAYGETMTTMVQAMNWKPKTAGVAWAETTGYIFGEAFGFAKVAAPYAAMWGISDVWRKANDSNNQAWSSAVDSVASNNLKEVTTTSTELVDTSTTVTETTSTFESYTDTFGTGNTIDGSQVNSDGSWFQSPDYSINSSQNPITNPLAPPAP